MSSAIGAAMGSADDTKFQVESGVKGERRLNPIVFLEITIGNECRGQLEVELRADLCPIASENFRQLCTGETEPHADGTKMHLKGTKFHRVVKDLMCQGGDLAHADGTWSQCVNHLSHDGSGEFPDENFILRHTGPGVLSMANRGPDSNGSQFYFSFIETAQFNNLHQVFGVVCNEDSLALLLQVEQEGTPHGVPKRDVLISDCGQLFP